MASSVAVQLNNEPVFPGFPVTGFWVAKVVEKHLGGGGAKLTEVSARRIDEGQGYCSIIVKLNLTWANGSRGESVEKNQLPNVVILKIPTFVKMEEMMLNENLTREQQDALNYQFLALAHNTECQTFSLFISLNRRKPVLVPKAFGLQKMVDRKTPAYILMEDLSEKGRTPDLMEGLSLEQCSQLIDNLASLHAFCISNSDWNANIHLKRRDVSDWGMSSDFLVNQVQSILQLSPAVFPEDSCLTSQDDLLQLFNLDKCCTEINSTQMEKTVLAHGDFWSNNFMFASDPVPENPRKTTQDLVAIIDWQAAYRGCCTDDISMLLVTSVDYKTRRDNEERLLEEYYTKLQQNLPNVQLPYSLEEVKLSYFKKSFRFSAVNLLIIVNIYLDTKQAAAKGYSAEELNKLRLRLRAATEDAMKHLALS